MNNRNLDSSARLFEVPHSKAELTAMCAHIPLFFVIGYYAAPELAVLYGTLATLQMGISGFRHITGRPV